MRATHRDMLEQRKWYSSRYGWVDLQEVGQEYLDEIKYYWFQVKRPQILKRIEVSNCVSDRNKRRYEVIAMYDELITRQLAKRLF